MPILFEDDDIIVLDKPAGVVVNRAASVSGTTVQDWVESYVHTLTAIPPGIYSPEETAEFISRSGVVHRIDKETSGILLVAKHPRAFFSLKSQFMAHAVAKEYRALVHGNVVPKDGEVSAPVGRLPWNRMRFGVFPEGRTAHTSYHAVSYFQKKDSSNDTYSLLIVAPTTGRTHQIRVHLQYLNHPIVSDPLYVGRKRLRSDKTWCTRLFLHASRIHFRHPVTNSEMDVQSPLPEDLQTAIHSLREL